MTQKDEFVASLRLAQKLLRHAQDAADVGEANQLCNRALGLRPRSVDAWLVKAQVLLRLEDGPAALATAALVVAQRPRSAEAHAVRAAALAQMERFPSALRAADRALKLCEENGGPASLQEELYYEKAAILDALERTGEALRTFEEGLRLFPGSELLKAGMAPLVREERRRSFRVLDGGLSAQPAR